MSTKADVQARVQSKLFDLKYQLFAYGSHHNNPWNVGIHITCVPLILWTALVWASKTGPLVQGPSVAAVAAGKPLAVLADKIFRHAPPNLAFLIMTGYVAYYIKLDKVAGLLTAPFFFGLAKTATTFAATNPNANKIAAYIHVVSWILQFIGHGVAEKRAPKLLDNVVQAVVLAPYFVVYEVLFWFGYRPQLKAELDVLIKEDIAAFRARKAGQNKDKTN
ncbi:hypothetical protein DFQ27_000026 [Actinomortierella ambigua]|uniref:DUF962-domain-containing protein n=1 Tax=Actinomortierella ambigua TaxID=1343610 RepID=A0A9P6QPL3_9FUNG|nr:hypothetical protein DFQ27_000026 [Actinomortierella ambigua]